MKPIKFSKYTTPDGVEKPCVILHYHASDYGSPGAYSKTQPREKPGRDVRVLIWIPVNGEALTMAEKADLNRGFTFFNDRNVVTGSGLGFLLGAQVELRRTGELLSADLPCARLS